MMLDYFAVFETQRAETAFRSFVEDQRRLVYLVKIYKEFNGFVCIGCLMRFLMMQS